MKTKKSLLASSIALLLCFAMLLGSTFAWFTDVVTSSGNKIQSGSLKLDLKVLTEVEATDGTTYYEWVSIKNDRSPLFTYENWEPGYTDVTILMVENLGTLALKWEARFASDKPLSALADVIDVYVKPGVTSYPANRSDLEANGWNNVGCLKDFVNKLSETTYGYLDGIGSGGTTSATLGIALKMREEAGNEYQNLTLGEFDIRIVATQAMKEDDSFGPDYDEDAQWPVFKGSVSASAPVTNNNGTLASDTTVSSTDGKISATLPAGVTLNNGTDKVTLSVSEKTESEAGILAAPGVAMSPVDVHIEGVAEGNTTPIPVTIQALLPAGLNAGNYKLYHVEDGNTIEMTLRAAGQTPAHNTFDYDPATGDVTLYLASFSEVMVQADMENKWQGGMDFSWYEYSLDGEIFKISNADQLAAFSAIVGGMKYDFEGNLLPEYTPNYAADSFEGKIVTLTGDIFIGDTDKYAENGDASANGFMFYPIGYYNTTYSYQKKDKIDVSSGFKRFKGTFDGCGHIISDFYQNTWEAFGDYNDGYSGTPNHNRDGFGLFGNVLGSRDGEEYTGGIIKNLTVNNFSSDGEFTTTGAIAAYADGALFENISITNCNPRVYNIGNGGIVGCVGWYAETAGLLTTFKNVTVDNSNKITALWGSWDVACGGIVGQYYPTSGQSAHNYPVNAGMHFENCHSSAVIDVYNDVCANYQYYAYRYSGLLIGSVRENVEEDGHSYPDMTGITASGCTVHFGDWNDYYYCEIVANSLASYTHDHQMSRLTQVKSIDVENMKYLPLGETNSAENWVNIPTSGWAHYVVVKDYNETTGKYTHGDGHGFADCYHFNNGNVHTHESAGTETVNGVPGILKEDKQLIYREFNNLVTGYGWGVTSKGVGDLDGVENLDDIIENEGESYDKFVQKSHDANLTSNNTYRFGEFFDAISNNPTVSILSPTVTISANNVTAEDKVTVEITRNKDNWENSTIVFRGAGTITLTIQDYYFCNPTTTTLQFEVHTSFLDHTVSPLPINDDFSHENSNTQENRWFETSGESAKYYISAEASNSNSDKAKYFYVETDVTIHGVLDKDSVAKIGFISGTNFRDSGDDSESYRASMFYLETPAYRYEYSSDSSGNNMGTGTKHERTTWNDFKVAEQHNNYNTIYSAPAISLTDATADTALGSSISKGVTFKIALLRDGDTYYFFINGQQAFTYKIDSTSELYEGIDAATNIGFFHDNVKATFSNYKVIRSDISAPTDGVPGHTVTDIVSVKDQRGYIEFTSSDPFTLGTQINGKHWNGKIYYTTSTVNDSTWSNWAEWDGKPITAVKNGDKYVIRLSGDGNTYITGYEKVGGVDQCGFGWTLTGDDDVYCSGNIMTLLDHAKVQRGETPEMGYAAFWQLFKNCTNLASAPTLPATVLTQRCYREMFQGCTSLEEAPVLPATTMWHECYNYMFNGCTSLVDAPDLPATELYLSCYSNMFSNCTSLETVSELPATELAAYCYYAMFMGCPNLKEIPYLPATQIAEHCYNYMFYNKDRDDANAGTGIKISEKYDAEKGYTTEYRIPVTNADIKADYSNYETKKDANGNDIVIDGKTQYNFDYRTYPVSQMFTYTDGKYFAVNDKLFTETHPAYGLGYLPGDIKVVGRNFVEFTSDSEITITSSNGGKTWTNKIEYSTDGKTWTEWTGTTIRANTIYMRGTGNRKLTASDQDTLAGWTITGENIFCNGNIEYLLDYKTVMAGGHPQMDNFCFKALFNGCTGLVKAPELPSMTVAYHGYHSMFKGCTSLVTAPKLPATKLATTCYGAMFADCTSLVNAPALPATTLAGWCYYGMFQGCTSLVNAPELPATTLAEDCYGYMFYGCTSLVNAPEQIPATTLTIRGCEYMFYGCTSLETVPELPATTLADRCYFWMFAGCTKLKEVPYLPATTLANHCYNHMFFGVGITYSNTQKDSCMTKYAFPSISDYVTTYYSFGQMFDGASPLDYVLANSLYIKTGITIVGAPVWNGNDVSTSLQGAGTEADPYLISSGADLKWLADQVGGRNNHFKMTNNIDLNGYGLTIGAVTGWSSDRFEGVFDGNGYSILNLKIDDTTSTGGVALFPLVYLGTIKNLTVYGTVNASAENVGGIVGWSHRGIIENCVSYVDVTSTGLRTGGVVGWINNASTATGAKINNCVNYGSVNGASIAGGIAGEAGVTVTNSMNYGTVTGVTVGDIFGK